MLERGRAAEAEPIARASLERYERLLPVGHRDTRAAKLYLAWALRDLGRFEDAEAVLRGILEEMSGAPPDHEPRLQYERRVAEVWLAAGRLDDAERELRRILGLRGDSNLKDSLRGLLHSALGRAARTRGDWQACAEHARTALGVLQARKKESTWDYAHEQSDLAECLLRLGQTEEPETLLTAAVERLNATLGPEAPVSKEADARLRSVQQMRQGPAPTH